MTYRMNRRKDSKQNAQCEVSMRLYLKKKIIWVTGQVQQDAYIRTFYDGNLNGAAVPTGEGCQ